MSVEFHLPDVGEGLHEAEVLAWLVSVGDVVRRDQPFVEVLTDKSTVELPAPAAGTITHLGAAVGDIVTVGELLIVIDNGTDASDAAAPGAPVPAPAAAVPIAAALAPSAVATAVTAAEPASPEVAAAQPGSAPGLRPKASPSTRRLAAERGIDLAAIAGTGPGGRILVEDLDAVIPGAEIPDAEIPHAGVPDVGDTSDLTEAINTIDQALLTPTMTGAVAVGALGATAAVIAKPVGAANTVAPAVEPAAAMPIAATPTPAPPEPASPTPTPPAPASPAPAAAPRASNGPLGAAEPGVMALRGVRRLTARAMDTSWSTIPHITAMNDVDATALLATRIRLRDAAGDAGGGITPLTLMLMAVAQALRTYPLMNATLDLEAETITVHEDVNLGVAVASEHGLIVPVVRKADTLGVLEMASEVTRLSTAARDRAITSADLTGGTFTVTNYGSFGGRFASPIIRPGESGIMGFGGIAKRPMVIDDAVLARPNLPVVLACDHRLIDGDLLSAFHNHVIDALADPTSILFKAAL